MSDCCDPVAAPTAPLGIALLFTTGFMISLGHCLGMCGPIVSAYAIAQGSTGRSTLFRVTSLLRYHLGRITSYAIIGVAFGLLGSLTLFARSAQAVQGSLSLVVASMMILLGLGLVGWLPTQRWIEGISVSRRITNSISSWIGSERATQQVGLGIANGFLPCGPVVAVALSTAATTNPWHGLLAMVIYGLGTVPALLLLGLGVDRLSPRLRLRFYRIGIGMILLIGLQLFLRGLAAFGLIGHLRFGEIVLW